MTEDPDVRLLQAVQALRESVELLTVRPSSVPVLVVRLASHFRIQPVDLACRALEAEIACGRARQYALRLDEDDYE